MASLTDTRNYETPGRHTIETDHLRINISKVDAEKMLKWLAPSVRKVQVKVTPSQWGPTTNKVIKSVLASAPLLIAVSNANAGCCKIGGTVGKIIAPVQHTATQVVQGAVVATTTTAGTAVGAYYGGPYGGVAGGALGSGVGMEINRCAAGHC